MTERQISNSLESAAKETANGFSLMADRLGEALGEFKKLQSSADYSALMRFFRPAAEKIQHAAQFTVGYSRRHPVRMAITVAAIGFVIAGLAKPVASKVAEELH